MEFGLGNKQKQHCNIKQYIFTRLATKTKFLSQRFWTGKIYVDQINETLLQFNKNFLNFTVFPLFEFSFYLVGCPTNYFRTKHKESCANNPRFLLCSIIIQKNCWVTNPIAFPSQYLLAHQSSLKICITQYLANTSSINNSLLLLLLRLLIRNGR